MLHSILEFRDENNHLMDFYRLKQKRPQTVINHALKAIYDFESFWLKQWNGCKKVVIFWTDYETNEDNKTFECTYDEFLKQYELYKSIRRAEMK